MRKKQVELKNAKSSIKLYSDGSIDINSKKSKITSGKIEPSEETRHIKKMLEKIECVEEGICGVFLDIKSNFINPEQPDNEVPNLLKYNRCVRYDDTEFSAMVKEQEKYLESFKNISVSPYLSFKAAVMGKVRKYIDSIGKIVFGVSTYKGILHRKEAKKLEREQKEIDNLLHQQIHDGLEFPQQRADNDSAVKGKDNLVGDLIADFLEASNKKTKR